MDNVIETIKEKVEEVLHSNTATELEASTQPPTEESVVDNRQLKEDRSAFNCPICKGEGLVTQDKLCPECGGTGKV